jgi:oligopeptide/dipeptide ABC transporter ATP-binding protein
VPSIDPERPNRRILLSGDVPNPANPPSGCVFHPRCPHAVERCIQEVPEWRQLEPNHWVACHRAHELQLTGTTNEVINLSAA